MTHYTGTDEEFAELMKKHGGTEQRKDALIPLAVIFPSASDTRAMLDEAIAEDRAKGGEVDRWHVAPPDKELSDYEDYCTTEEAAKKLESKGWKIKPLYTRSSPSTEDSPELVQWQEYVGTLRFALRKAIRGLPRFSFLSPQVGGVVRVPDSCGRWIERDSVTALFEPEMLDLLAPMPASQPDAEAAPSINDEMLEELKSADQAKENK
jgi:hypothetical protein